MAASQPQNSLEETIGAIPTSELLSDSRDRSAPSLSKDLKSHTYPGDDEECAISPPSLSYLSSLACPGSRPDVSKSENSVEEASWAMGASRHYSSSESSDAACRPKKDGGLSSPCHSGSDGGKGCEKKVSSVVKGVHAKLRRKLKEGR
ncbi:uncharacterized protein LOC105436798 [Strongylocentrotus purpuratus]|uniref:Uncharacterized protein n=1 Tax=Strongylocentrotus purpuratus TaxID=7668 RepID=A0A7M7LVI5_STRPU|nr:uncharacterized protein LOC105436798 [Strongylocentrotus purpuratus]|eukprot:XP_011661068.1 PREDICTED: uncharacterized protein LOC105436798 [Strongylocentrotus purpuratus]